MNQMILVLRLVLSQTRRQCLSASGHNLEELTSSTLQTYWVLFQLPCVNLQILKLPDARLVAGTERSAILQYT